MSEVKTREEKCFLNSPCTSKNRICNLSNNSCEYPSDNLIFYIKDRGYSGDISTIIDKINQIYGHIVNVRCNSGNDAYIGETYRDIKSTLKKGDLLVFYFLENNKAFCLSLADFYDSEVVRGVTINSRELKRLERQSEKMLDHFRLTKKGEEIQRVKDVYIKQSQFHHILKRGFNFFVVLPTNVRWVSYTDDTLHMLSMLVPISSKVEESKSEKKELEQKYCKTSYNRYQNILFNKVKELYSAILADEGNIKKINKKLRKTKVQLASDSNNMVIKSKVRKLAVYDKMIEKMKGLKPTEKKRYPYWYSLSDPLGKKFLSLGGKLKPFEYNKHPVVPVYKGLKEILVCQSKDMNYEVNLYAYIDNKKIFYSQSILFLLTYRPGRYVRIPLNKKLPYGIHTLKKIDKNKVYLILGDEVLADKAAPIYCVELTMNNNNTERVYYSTSKNAVEQYYNGIEIFNDDIKKKQLIRIEMEYQNPYNEFTTIKEDNMTYYEELLGIAVNDDPNNSINDSLNYSDSDFTDSGLNFSADDAIFKRQLAERLVVFGDHLIRHYNMHIMADDIRLQVNAIKEEFLNAEYSDRQAILNNYRESQDAIRVIMGL